VALAGGRVAGAVCAQLVPVDTCQDQELVAPHTKGGHAVTHVLYILTLGADQSYRKRGIATRLLQLCEEYALHASDAGILCGAIYLHVVSYNSSAAAFYERCGFRMLRQVRDYYLINERYFDSIVCILVLNGASLPLTWWQTVTIPFSAMASLGRRGWRRVSGLLRSQPATVAADSAGSILSQLDSGRIMRALRQDGGGSVQLQHSAQASFMV